MVFIKRICPIDKRKAIIAVKATVSSPTLSINDTHNGEGPQLFHLQISLHITETTRPSEAITISTKSSIFAPSDASSELNTLARGTVSLSLASDLSRQINLGQFKIHAARAGPPQSPDLKDRPSEHLLTVPATGEVEITHDLPPARIFRYSDRLRAEDVVVVLGRFGRGSER